MHGPEPLKTAGYGYASKRMTTTSAVTRILLLGGRAIRRDSLRCITPALKCGGLNGRSSSSRCYLNVRAGTNTNPSSSISSSRRRFSDSASAPPYPPPPPPGVTGSNSDPLRAERGRFVVTGSLLDARRAGSDSPVPGQFLCVSHAFNPEAVESFAAHVGDDNPIHVDEEYARHAGPRSYDGCIVHGLMVAGLFSTAFGRAISGALYVSQTLKFERPVLVGERVDVRIEVERARVTSSGREVLVRCSTQAFLTDGTVAVSGQAKVLLPRTCEVRSW
ncbi:unnamed protein product [Pylaiella littoralis]